MTDPQAAPLMPPGPECLTYPCGCQAYPCGCQGSPASEVPNYCPDHGKSPFNRGFQRTAKPEPETDAPKGWAIDYSTGSPILTYEACSVIQDEQAHLVMDLLGRAAKPQAAPLVPPMPWAEDDLEHIDGPKAWGRQCAEIAQAQARRAEKAESAIQDVHSALGNEIAHEGVRLKAMRVRSERDALKARVAEAESRANEYADMNHKQAQRFAACEATLAQRDREVISLREALGKCRLQLWHCNQQLIHEGYQEGRIVTDALESADKALAATAQAGADAERRLLEAAWERVRYHPRNTGEAVNLEFQGVKAAMLGTGGEDK